MLVVAATFGAAVAGAVAVQAAVAVAETSGRMGPRVGEGLPGGGVMDLSWRASATAAADKQQLEAGILRSCGYCAKFDFKACLLGPWYLMAA